MVITRRKNATEEANPSVTKFSKEQNDLKMKELKEEERVQAAEYESSIPSDHNPDSESSGASSELASSHP